MGINWKVRLRNKQFWIATIALLAALANQIAAVFGQDITVYSEQATEIAETILLILSGIGIIVDPTTKGVKDSKQAMEYTEPK